MLEIRSRKLADLVRLLQYSHELLSLCIGLQIQWRLSLMTKAQVIAKVTEVLAIERRSIVTAYDTGMPNEAKVLSIFGIAALALVDVTNSTYAHLDCLHTVTSRYSPV